MEDLSYDYLFKIIIIGDSGVGKTSLMERYVDNIYNECKSSTIGVDFKIKTFDIDGKRLKLQIWDTAGQERFRAIVGGYYRGANGILMIFDITSKDSFIHLKEWMDEIKKRDVPSTTEIIVLGNKIDEKDKIDVRIEEIIEFLDMYSISRDNFYEVSARDGSNVEQGFVSLARKILSTQGRLSNQTTSKPLFTHKKQNNKRCC